MQLSDSFQVMYEIYILHALYVHIKLKDCWVNETVYISKVVCLLVDVTVTYHHISVID